jgi:RND superfamily putative drug exporter
MVSQDLAKEPALHMAALPSPEQLARFSTRRPWLVVGLWVAVLVAALAAATRVGDVLTTGAENYVSTGSRQANDILEERFFGRERATEVVVVQSPSRTTDDPAYRAFVEDLTARIRGLGADVESVTNIYESGAAGLVSSDGRTTLLPLVLLGEKVDAEDHVEPLIALLETVDGRDGFTVVTGGDGSSSLAFTEQSQEDLRTAEVFGVPIALVILVLVFGALLAAGLPLVLGIVSILIAVGLTAVIGQAFELSTFVINFVTTMGLAVGIDYSLIVVQRFREERGRGLPRDEAIVAAGGTASRAVLFSGMAVIVALFGMVIVPNSIFRSLGVGAILVVAVAIMAALTLLPAILRLLGDRVNSVRVRIPGLGRRSERRSFWDVTTAFVVRHPVPSLVASVALLVAAATPYATIKLGWAGVSSLPEDTQAHRAFAILDEEFSAGVLSPASVVVDGSPDDPDVAAGIELLIARLGQDREFGPATVEANAGRDAVRISVPLAGDPQGNAARDAVFRLRGEYIPEAFGRLADRVFVTGATAEGADNTGIIRDYTIPVFAFVLGLSFVILLLVFRSIVVPIKAMIMNLLSVGAAYGLMVLVFQHGVGNELFGFSQVERIESWVPLFMFATLFGLSMDYHVFLLSRIRERFIQTGDNSESVAYGVRTTAGLITGAAAIMVAVFAGFAAGKMVMFEQMGFGMAVAVFLDATIVRSILVPASMQLLGERNWYLPSWLGWLPRIDVEGRLGHAAGPTPAADPLPGR